MLRKIDRNEIPSIEKRSTYYGDLTKMLRSGIECAEVTDFMGKSANAVSAGYRFAIKENALPFSVIVRKNRVFIARKEA